ncbi:glycosyltransferase, partial [uncultured Bacteroides sp.]
MSPNYSVLISVYYKERPIYLKSALDSVLNQTLPPSEIILVKDGPLTAEL